jgi:hypothetical protein
VITVVAMSLRIMNSKVDNSVYLYYF